MNPEDYDYYIENKSLEGCPLFKIETCSFEGYNDEVRDTSLIFQVINFNKLKILDLYKEMIK